MSETVFPRSAPIDLGIRHHDQRYPVNRVFCVGRNYLAHALEMGNTVDKQSQDPIYFMKHAGHLVPSGSTLRYPPGTNNLHHEMELVVALGGTGAALQPEAAEELIFGYACGLDMTRRDLQSRAKKDAGPWDLAKNFEGCAVLSPITPMPADGPVVSGRIELSVNGEIRQSSDLSRMIWNVREIIVDLSRYYRLQPGDLVFTGTPEGVGPVGPGDRLEGAIEGVGEISAVIAAD